MIESFRIERPSVKKGVGLPPKHPSPRKLLLVQVDVNHFLERLIDGDAISPDHDAPEHELQRGESQEESGKQFPTKPKS